MLFGYFSKTFLMVHLYITYGMAIKRDEWLICLLWFFYGNVNFPGQFEVCLWLAWFTFYSNPVMQCGTHTTLVLVLRHSQSFKVLVLVSSGYPLVLVMTWLGSGGLDYNSASKHETQIYSICRNSVYVMSLMAITTSGHAHQFLLQMEYTTEENFRAFLWVNQWKRKKSLPYSTWGEVNKMIFFSSKPSLVCSARKYSVHHEL